MKLIAGMLSQAKGSVSDFWSKLLLQEAANPSDWIMLDIWVLLSFYICWHIVSKWVFYLVVCLVDRNNSCDIS